MIRGRYSSRWILLDSSGIELAFALLKWKIESVTLAPLLTPEDTKAGIKQ